MTRYVYGGTAADFVYSSGAEDGDPILGRKNILIPLWTDQARTTIATDLQELDGTPKSTVRSDENCLVEKFTSELIPLWTLGPDGTSTPLYPPAQQQIDTLGGTYRREVFHGGDTNYPRPDWPYPLHWVGTVDPGNRLAIDSRDLIVTAPPTGGPVPPPTNLRAGAGDTTVTLTWTDPATPGANGIRIYRSGVLQDTLALGVQTWQTEGLTNGTRYSFDVRAIDSTHSSESVAAGPVVACPNVIDQTSLFAHFRLDTPGLLASDGITSLVSVDSNAWALPVAGNVSSLPIVRDSSSVGLGNGLPGLRLNVDGYLANDIADQVATGASVFLVFRDDALATGSAYFSSGTAASTDTFQIAQLASTHEVAMGTATTDRRTIGAVTNGQVKVLDAHWTASGALFFQNGVASTGSVNAGSNLVAQTTTAIKALKIGATRGGTSATGKFTLFELVIYRAAGGITSTQRDAVRANLIAKYAVT